ncbi:hypothetical protein ABVS_1240 [Acinetobacter lwoffii]|nr:hypothetical protein ABVS_1240 [Acinetobacter lwoffii]
MLQTHNNSSGFRIFHYLKTGKSLLKAGKEVLCSHRIGFFSLQLL